MLDSYSFTRPLTSDGKPTHYLSVLALLDKGSVHRHEILKSVWHVTNMNYHEFYRGYMSTLFAAMRRHGIISYSTKTRKWSITDKGKTLLENAKGEWGRRYAEKLWNHDIDDLHIFRF